MSIVMDVFNYACDDNTYNILYIYKAYIYTIAFANRLFKMETILDMLLLLLTNLCE